MPAILDSLFHKLVNTTCIPIRVEGGGAPQSAWRDVDLPILKNYTFNSGCFQLHISQSVATSTPSLTSQSCSDSLPDVCLAGEIWSHLQTTRALADARQAREWGLSKSTSLKLWQWYKHELLVYCCICWMAVKVIFETVRVAIRPLWKIWSHL